MQPRSLPRKPPEELPQVEARGPRPGGRGEEVKPYLFTEKNHSGKGVGHAYPLVTSILGIPCAVRSRALRKVIRRVLEQIRDRASKDFRRICQRVLSFVPVAETGDGTEGEWKCNGEPYRNDQWEYIEPQGVVELNELTTHPVATVAHELGHACTREEDRYKRENGINDEWANELTADSYAYKWLWA